VGLALDSFSSLARKEPIDSLRSIDPAKLFHVQVADAPSLSMDPLSWSRHFRCMPGQGDLPLVAYVAALREIGYRGVLSLEIFNDRFLAGSAAEVAVDGMRSLSYLLEQVSQQADCRVQCQRVEFIEFCANEEEASQLGHMLQTLGFRADRPPSTQGSDSLAPGDINLIVNCEPEGFAHSYDTVHGASVCAIGVRVADPMRRWSVHAGCRSAAFRSRWDLGVRDSSRTWRRRQPRLFRRGRRRGCNLADRVRTLGASWIVARRRLATSRSPRAVDAIRRDVVVAAVLRGAVPG
jgi:hypothetical protein